MTDTFRILIVEDDPSTAEAIARSAGDLGAETEMRDTWDSGLAEAASGRYDIVVMDRMLPGGDGLDAVARMRAAGSNALVFVVSALGTASSRIEGLERGADDYLAKPFDPGELSARLRALLRRTQMHTIDNDLMSWRDVELRLKARTLHIGQTHVALSPREFELFSYFAANAGDVVTRMQLLENVWNLHFDPQTNVVDVHVGRLRRKLEAAAGRPLIHTARGQGYAFDPERDT